jgi:hypothetical protein
VYQFLVPGSGQSLAQIAVLRELGLDRAPHHLQLDRVPIGSGRQRPVLPQISGSIRRLGSPNFGAKGEPAYFCA